MQARICRYKTRLNKAGELAKRFSDGLAPMIGKATGFLAHYVVEGEKGAVTSISFFVDQAGVEEANQMAAAWEKENIASLLDGPPEITMGSVTVQGRKSFNQMSAEAYASVPAVKPGELQRWMQQEPKPLIIDVQDAADIALTGSIPGAVNISLGSMTYKADHELPEDWRDARLNNHAMLIVTTCAMGPMGALGGKLLLDLGFTNVYILEGGVEAWKEAGYGVQ